MNSASGPLILPLTFPAATGTRDDATSTSARDLIEQSCSRVHATSLVSWGLSQPDFDGNLDLSARGAAVGGDDGSIYVFRPSAPTSRNSPASASNSVSHESSHLNRSSSQAKGHRNHSTSRSASPSSSVFHQSPFNVTSRSRIVSGISKEQVEAPKNYVDFEDEPDKLKDMLKGKGPRKSISDGTALSLDKGFMEKTASLSPTSSSAMLPGSYTPKRRDDAKSLLSALNSPLVSPKPSSIPGSPSIPAFSLEGIDAQSLSLYLHIVPHRSGLGRAATQMCLLDSDRVLVALQETGEISLYKIKDGACIARSQCYNRPAATSVTENPDALHTIWKWTRLQAYDNGESKLLLASATADGTMPSDAQDGNEHSKVLLALFEFFPGEDVAMHEPRLAALGEWVSDGFTEQTGLHREPAGDWTFYRVDSRGHLITQHLDLSRLPIPVDETPAPEPSTNNLLPLPNPFKALQNRSAEHVPLVPDSTGDRESSHLGSDVDLGELSLRSIGLRTRDGGDTLRCIAWSAQELTVLEVRDGRLRSLFVSPMGGIESTHWLDDATFCVVYKGRVEHHKLKVVDANDNEVAETANVWTTRLNVQSRELRSFDLGRHDALYLSSSSELFTTGVDKAGRRKLETLKLAAGLTEATTKLRRLWKASHRKSADLISTIRVTCVLPLELELIFMGLSDGHVRRSSLTEMARGTPVPPGTCTQCPLGGPIVALHQIHNTRTKEPFIVGGADDGSIAFWAADSLALCARWIVFTTPLVSAVQVYEQTVGTLRGCLLCVSYDGTIAVIAVDGFQLLHLIPGSAAPLRRICLGSDNLMLTYLDGRARMWDVKTKEFWRSMGRDKAEEIIGQGGWNELVLEEQAKSPPTISVFKGIGHALDSASTLLLDVERFVSTTMASARPVPGGDRVQVPHNAANRLRWLLSLLLTPGLNEETDYICSERLGIFRPGTPIVGSSSLGAASLFHIDDPRDYWTVSPDVSANRAIAILLALRALGNTEGLGEDTTTVITFYTASLSSPVGALYQPPSLIALALRWFDSTNDSRQSARMIFDAEIIRMSEQNTILLAEHWQHHLPCLQPDADKQSMKAALALFICGYTAAEKYSLLSTSTLTDIAKSITTYLHDEQSVHRVLAIDLCSRGFQIWQHYVDAMEILRSLFSLATNSRKEAISPHGAGPQARAAVLQIAASNTPLFMTTLALDILTPRSVEHRKCVMQLVAFLIRKRPLVIFPNLPRLMEAVVKSLDPNSTANRDAVLDAATDIMGHVVKTFPTVDFHMGSQRLAVGTSEGAIVMYDLKTATRLYVLEGHKKRLAACSFSPDGRRLVSVSLEEDVVLVWKVGSSFTSFFKPGAPPRQGHGGSEPFKTISFNVGDEANLSVSQTLEWVKFEWPAERSVRLKIRESVLTFST